MECSSFVSWAARICDDVVVKCRAEILPPTCNNACLFKVVQQRSRAILHKLLESFESCCVCGLLWGSSKLTLIPQRSKSRLSADFGTFHHRAAEATLARLDNLRSVARLRWFQNSRTSVRACVRACVSVSVSVECRPASLQPQQAACFSVPGIQLTSVERVRKRTQTGRKKQPQVIMVHLNRTMPQLESPHSIHSRTAGEMAPPRATHMACFSQLTQLGGPASKRKQKTATSPVACTVFSLHPTELCPKTILRVPTAPTHSYLLQTPASETRWGNRRLQARNPSVLPSPSLPRYPYPGPT